MPTAEFERSDRRLGVDVLTLKSTHLREGEGSLTMLAAPECSGIETYSVYNGVEMG